jgi:hypothetical protein
MTGRTLLAALGLTRALNSNAYGADKDTVGNAQAKTPTEIAHQRMNTMKIRLTVNGKAITATMIDNATSRDFLSLLPMTLTLEDYALTEKISYLPRKLSQDGAPAGVDPSVGDITYYAPWRNLAIFYKDFGYASGLIKLGRIDSGTEVLNVPGSMKVTFELLGR